MYHKQDTIADLSTHPHLLQARLGRQRYRRDLLIDPR